MLTVSCLLAASTNLSLFYQTGLKLSCLLYPSQLCLLSYSLLVPQQCACTVWNSLLSSLL